jgi:hypothetical protein
MTERSILAKVKGIVVVEVAAVAVATASYLKMEMAVAQQLW